MATSFAFESLQRFSGHNFVPDGITNFLCHDRVPCRIKMRPEDFVVEERGQDGKLYTVDPVYVHPEDCASTSSPGLVGVTLVKRCLTTYSAIYQLARGLGISAGKVSYGGLKDRWALTAQRIVIADVFVEDVVRMCCPETIAGKGYFLKDPQPTQFKLQAGKLQSNRFTLNVSLPGLRKAEIDQYLAPRLKLLSQRADQLRVGSAGADDEFLIPNGYGRQRLGPRQNLAKVGAVLIAEGAESAIYRFLTEKSGKEKAGALALRDEMANLWPNFTAIKSALEPAYSDLNLDLEYLIATRLARCGGNFNQVVQILPDEFKLWVGSYQSYWYNQVLERFLRGEVNLGGSQCIPMFMFEPECEAFYRKNCPEAIPTRVDPIVKKLFLTPQPNRKGKIVAPWRPALIPVRNLTHRSEDGMWRCQFELRSGGYATTLLAVLFQLEQDEDETTSENGAGPGYHNGKCFRRAPIAGRA